METSKTLDMLKEVRSKTTDPALQKELDAKIKALSNNEIVRK